MNAIKWAVIVTSLPLVAGCEEASGQCARAISAPGAPPPAAAEETESAAPAAVADAPAPTPQPSAAPISSAAPAPTAVATAPAGSGVAAPSSSTSAPAAIAPPPPPQNLTIEGTLTATPERAAAHDVVYLVDAPIVPTRGMKALVDQRSMAFIPYVTAIAAGGTVTFLNSDPFPHNVFSPNGQKFNIGMLNQGQRRSVTLREPGDYALLCNVHPGMLGHVYVAPSSYFAVSDAHGRFAIKDVPEGTYRIAVWAGKFTAEPQTVKLQGANATVDFALHR
jgi:plastocyanin